MRGIMIGLGMAARGICACKQAITTNLSSVQHSHSYLWVLLLPGIVIEIILGLDNRQEHNSAADIYWKHKFQGW